MSSLLDTLAAELERPRPIPDQVVHHLGEVYGVDRDEVGPFLVRELPAWEDYQVDLALSPVFTPTLAEQGVFAELLGVVSIPASEWHGLVATLAKRPVQARLVTTDGQIHILPLREVTIERFLHRLRLDGTIPESMLELLNGVSDANERALLKAVARRAIWENGSRREILARLLAAASGETRLPDALELLRLMETYQPADAASLLARIPQWQQVLRQQIEAAAGPKPFFNERVEELHGGGRDQRGPVSDRIAVKTREHDFLNRLRQVLSD